MTLNEARGWHTRALRAWLSSRGDNEPAARAEYRAARDAVRLALAADLIEYNRYRYARHPYRRLRVELSR